MNALRRTLAHLTLRIVIALIPSVFLMGCSGSNSSVPATVPPAIKSLSPGSVTADVASFTLTVNGTGFVSGSSVQWNGNSRPTTFTSATQITAAIPTADVAAPGTAQVSVVNPDAQKSASVREETAGVLARASTLAVSGESLRRT